MDNVASAKKKHDDGATWETLAVVRFLLAGIVVITHAGLLRGAPAVVHALAEFSSLAAIVGFLMISGFSIAHSIARRRDGFYRRRIGRIYPLYILSILFGLVIRMVLWKTWLPLSRANTINLFENLFFLQTYVAQQTPLNPVVWTLAVEVGCYALAPVLMKTNVLILLALSVASAVSFALYPRYVSVFYASTLGGEALLVLSWAWLGGFVFYRYRDRWLAAIALAAVTYLLLWLNPKYTLGRNYPITVAVVIAGLARGSRLRPPRVVGRWMTFLGDVSYPLYLFHVPTFVMLLALLEFRSFASLLMGSLAVAVAMLGVDSLLKQSTRQALDGISHGFKKLGSKRKDQTSDATRLRTTPITGSATDLK